MKRKSANRHVYPVPDQKHITEGIMCWCLPYLLKLCPFCDHDGRYCCNCDSTGLVFATQQEFEDGVEVIVMHNRLT